MGVSTTIEELAAGIETPCSRAMPGPRNQTSNSFFYLFSFRVARLVFIRLFLVFWYITLRVFHSCLHEAGERYICTVNDAD